MNPIVQVPESTSKDEYIKKLQAELEQLKGEHGIGSSSHRFMQSQSPVSKRKNGPAGQKVCNEEFLCLNTKVIE